MTNEPDPLLTRYLNHIDHAERMHAPVAWHVAAARGLYRLMVDREMAGGEPCPMGMPHLLCMSDEEAQRI